MSAFSKVYGPASRVTRGPSTPLRILKRGIRVVENYGHSVLIRGTDGRFELVSAEALRRYIRSGLVGDRLCPGEYHDGMTGPVTLVNERIGVRVWQSADGVYLEEI